MQTSNGTGPQNEVVRRIGLGVILAYGTTAWLQLLHAAEGARFDLGFLVQLLRDGTMALPVGLAAIWGALWATRNIRLDRLARFALSAIAVSTLLSLGGAMRDLVFAIEHPAPLPLALYLVRDALFAIAVAVPAALLTVLATTRRARTKSFESTTPRRRRLVAQLMVACLMGIAGATALPAVGSAQEAPQADPGLPCPATAPVKTFDVSAIDVRITYNRFGDNDPFGKMYVLDHDIGDVRAQEASGEVTLGLRDDPIQPLVIRANNGDCVEISFTDRAGNGDFGVHIDGLAYEIGSSGDAIGRNPESVSNDGETITYRYYVPKSPLFEGAHYMHPGPGNRFAVSHGLFGALVVEPKGSIYLHPETLQPIDSGWEAVIDPAMGPSFREATKLFHEVGNEAFQPSTRGGGILPLIDNEFSGAYRPGGRALNYRSEPFFNRLKDSPRPDLLKSLAYGSYSFGDPSTPIPRAYLADPVKFRVIHVGSEVFHVYHLHGGGLRWRFNPRADTTFDYGATGLNKHPATVNSPSNRLDSQSIGPGESYNMELEGGAGGVQQAAGDFLWHCHIAHHYVAGMWSFFRTYDTRQVDLAPLPDRAPPPSPIDSAGLIGKTMPNGVTITRDNLDLWIRPQIPPQGVRFGPNDATVWDWRVDDTDPLRPVYLGEVEDVSDWPNLPRGISGHPGSFPGDQLVNFSGGTRPKILFNPLNGRPAYPLLRPQIFQRPPFSPNGHSGAPWLGEDADASPESPVDPYAGRDDGLCPKDTVKTRNYNVVAIERPVEVAPGATDPDGKFFVLAQDKERMLDPANRIEPLAIRANVGDCGALTLTSEQTDADGADKVNMHIHHVQFDPQASDGVITGLQYEQSVRPYKLEDPTLLAMAHEGDDVLQLSDVSRFRPGITIGVGLGTDDIEIHEIAAVNALANTVRLVDRLDNDHAAGQWAGVEFVQYRWYPDVELDNIFWHDHVDGIHGWAHGLVGQFIVEPPGSTYHDPVTGEEVESGTIVDIHTSNALIPGEVDGSFREVVLWTINDNPASEAGFNVKSEPWLPRLLEDCPALPTAACADPSVIFSSYAHADPITPLPRAFAGDDVVFRLINGGPTLDTFRIDGHRFHLENRYFENGEFESALLDTLHFGISEKFTVALDGGAGGPQQVPGDYMYMNGVGRRFRSGAWGILRVLPGQIEGCSEDLSVPGSKCLQGLPERSVTATTTLPDANSAARPLAAPGPGDPCNGAPEDVFNITSVDLPTSVAAARLAYVPSNRAAAAEAGTFVPEPLVMHVAAGTCLVVNFTNRATENGSFHVGKLLHAIGSTGVNVGFNPEQTVPNGATRTYRFLVDSSKLGSVPITDMGGDTVLPDAEFEGDIEPARDGLYGAVVVHDSGATFTDPVSGDATRFGSSIDVHVAGSPGYRDFTLLFADLDEKIGGDSMPYKTVVEDAALLNYKAVNRVDDATTFSSLVHGDPSTPILRAYAGDPTMVHAIVAPGSEQLHSFSLGGHTWPIDRFIHNSSEVSTLTFGPWESIDAWVTGGAGGLARGIGDYFYGDLRRPFTEAGLWGIFRVLGDESCPVRPLFGLGCLGQSSLSRLEAPDPDPSSTVTPGDSTGNSGGGGGGGGAVTTSPSPSGSSTADATAPIGSVQVLRERFSPNGDGKKDSARFDVALSETASWTLRVMRGEDDVYSTSGEGNAARIQWDGAPHADGAVEATGVPQQGAYLWILSAEDAAGNRMDPIVGSVVVDLTAPRIHSVALSRSRFDPTDRAVKLTFAVNEASRIKVAVRRNGSLVRRFETTVLLSQGRVSIRWNGRNDAGRMVADGRYVFRIRATDPAANGPTTRRTAVRVT